MISVAAGDEITNLFSLTMSFNCIIDSQIQVSAVRSLHVVEQFCIDKNEGFFFFFKGIKQINIEETITVLLDRGQFYIWGCCARNNFKKIIIVNNL